MRWRRRDVTLKGSGPCPAGDEEGRGLVADAAEGGVPVVRGAAAGARRADRPHRHGGRPEDLPGAVVLPAVRRPGPQVPHAVHHRQGASRAGRLAWRWVS